MSKHLYPRIGRADSEPRWLKLPPDQGPRCVVCGGKALFKVHVQVSWFRGDDEVFKTCGQHKGDAQALLATMETGG